MEVLKVLQDSRYFRKTNYLIEAKYKMSVLQTFIFTQTYMSLADDNINNVSHKVYFKDIIDNFGLNPKGDTYEKIIQAARGLREKELIFQAIDENGQESTVYTGFFTSVKVHKRKNGELACIETFIAPELKPHLIQLKRFTLLDKTLYAYICGQLHHPLIIRIYDLLKQYEPIGKRRIEVKQLKEMLGAEDKYELYGNFKQKIILEAQRRLLAHADICFEVEEIKQGRSVVELLFHIYWNMPENMPEKFKEEVRLAREKRQAMAALTPFEVIEQSPEQPLFLELIGVAQSLGITELVLRNMIEEAPAEAVKDGLNYTRKEAEKGRIKENIDGYFIAAVRKGFTNKGIQDEKAKNKRQIEQKIKNDEKIQLEKALADIREAYNTQINALIRELTLEDDSITVLAIETVKKEQSHYFQIKGVNPDDLTVEDYRKDPILRNLVIAAIQKRFADRFEPIHRLFKPQIQQISTQIKLLK